MRFSNIKRLTVTALSVALCVVLPMAFHIIPNAGSVMLPMHIPVLLCGLICGWQYGLLCGILGPSLLPTRIPSRTWSRPITSTRPSCGQRKWASPPV